MKRQRVQHFLAEKCWAIDSRARSLVRDVLLRLPDEFDTESISDVFSVYAGSVFPPGGAGWAVVLQWDILNAPFEASVREAKRKKEVARGVIALNLAHCTLRHTPNTIHTKRAYNEAKELAIDWGFSREITSMEKELL